MSRSQEENVLLEQRIQMMKQKSEALKRRHMEVEADKLSAAKQNALVQMHSPPDEEWIPGRHTSPDHDDGGPQRPGEQPPTGNRFISRGRGNRTEQRRSWSNHDNRDDYSLSSERSDGGNRRSRPSQNPSAPGIRGRRSDYQNTGRNNNNSVSEFDNSNENRHAVESSYHPPNDPVSGRHWERVGNGRQWTSNRGQRNDLSSTVGDVRPGSLTGGPTVTSKVFKNRSMETDHSKALHSGRPVCRLAEGDGPPPDPSYSFLGDEMRDPYDSRHNRQRPPNNNRRGGLGRGSRPWNDRSNSGLKDWSSRSEWKSPRSSEDGDPRQHSYEAWRRERNQIDQDRINRQKTSDGSWSREWDCNKVLQDESSDHSPKRNQGERGGGRRRTRSQRGGPEESRNIQARESQDKFSNQNYATSSGINENNRKEADKNSPMRWDRRPQHTKAREKHPAEQSLVNQRLHHFVNSKTECKDSQGSGDETTLVESTLLSASMVETERLQVSVICDASGTPTCRCVEGVGGTFKMSVSNTSDTHPQCNTRELSQSHKASAKVKRKTVSSSNPTASTSTTPQFEEEDGSWEDVSSDDEDVSDIAELQDARKADLITSKTTDTSSGPESLDPIPAPGKEDEFLWEEFHPTGFQNNMTLAMETEAAYKALQEEQKKEHNAAESDPNPPVKFKIDTACLEDSGDEIESVKLDPLLVTTHIVQAEVDCMSFTSVTTDISLPEDLISSNKKADSQENPIGEEEKAKPADENVLPIVHEISAEELSGPVSILGLQPSSAEIASSDSVTSVISIKSELCKAVVQSSGIKDCAEDLISSHKQADGQENQTGEEEKAKPADENALLIVHEISAEELSGPVSILGLQPSSAEIASSDSVTSVISIKSEPCKAVVQSSGIKDCAEDLISSHKQADGQENQTGEEEKAKPAEENALPIVHEISAEELSGPVSILGLQPSSAEIVLSNVMSINSEPCKAVVQSSGIKDCTESERDKNQSKEVFDPKERLECVGEGKAGLGESHVGFEGEEKIVCKQAKIVGELGKTEEATSALENKEKAESSEGKCDLKNDERMPEKTSESVNSDSPHESEVCNDFSGIILDAGNSCCEGNLGVKNDNTPAKEVSESVINQDVLSSVLDDLRVADLTDSTPGTAIPSEELAIQDKAKTPVDKKAEETETAIRNETTLD